MTEFREELIVGGLVNVKVRAVQARSFRFFCGTVNVLF